MNLLSCMHTGMLQGLVGPAQGAAQAGQVVERVAEQQAHQTVQPLAGIHVHGEAETGHAGIVDQKYDTIVTLKFLFMLS